MTVSDNDEVIPCPSGNRAIPSGHRAPELQRKAAGAAPVSRKCVCRVIRAYSLLLARRYIERPKLTREGKVATLRSNIPWRSEWGVGSFAGIPPPSVARSCVDANPSFESPPAPFPLFEQPAVGQRHFWWRA